MIENLITHWGYLGIGVGTFLEGESVLFIGGALAHKGLLQLPFVALAAFIGSLLGDQLWFALGKSMGKKLLATRPRLRTQAERATILAARWGDLFVLGFRFLWGLRNVSPFLLAISNYSWRRFAVLNVAVAAIWALIISGLGWLAGVGFEKTVGRAAHMGELGLGLVVVAAGLFFLLHHRRSTS